MSKTTAELIQDAIDLASTIEDDAASPSIGVHGLRPGFSELRKILIQAKLRAVESSGFPRVER